MVDVPVRARRAKLAAAPSILYAEKGALIRVPFHGEELEAVRVGDRVFVSIRRVCDVLGLDMAGQLAKLRRKPWATVEMISMVADDGKVRDVACIDLDGLPMWLASVELRRVKPELHNTLVLFQRDAARVLADHIFGPRLAVPALPAHAAAPSEARRAALHRLDTVERALEIVAMDIAVLASINRKVYVGEMHTRIVTGLTWTWDATQIVTAAFSLLPDPVVEARFEEVRGYWTRLSAAYKVL